MAKRVNILSVRAIEGFWQGAALLDASETMLSSDMDATAYTEAVARETFVTVITVVGARGETIRDAVTTALLDTYNSMWRQGRTAKLTRAAFAKKLAFRRIHCSEPDHPSRLISIQLGGADMLGGHLIGCIVGWDGTPLFAPAVVAHSP